MSSFTAIDVETANADLESICQIGIARFKDGELAGRWESLVNPQDYFDPFNVAIHGIDEDMVAHAPTFDDVHRELLRMLTDQVVVSHTHFDRIAVERVCERYDLTPLSCTWLDSARIVRRAWPDRYAESGYGLANVAADLGIEYRAHDALEDARAAGLIVLHAVEATGLSISEWLTRVRKPIRPAPSGADYDPNPEGPLFGEVVCFTGALTIPRRDAAAIAAAAGCVIGDGVTRHTTLLVVGDQDVRKLAGHKVSSKHRKAEQLIAEGQTIRILTERDFRRITQVNFADDLAIADARKPNG
jgi:DNA polymerase III subunit epsilon